MVENQLHRYSKVLEYNIRNVFSVKQLPTCLELEPLNTNQPGLGTEAALRWGVRVRYPAARIFVYDTCQG